ncbi:hypothetical protein B0H11DRAFT_1931283 [Mycena galericulata]|nr:hypothetical protein B0H11DRAFT_1931283 [Mycena galericulata]
MPADASTRSPRPHLKRSASISYLLEVRVGVEKEGETKRDVVWSMPQSQTTALVQRHSKITPVYGFNFLEFSDVELNLIALEACDPSRRVLEHRIKPGDGVGCLYDGPDGNSNPPREGQDYARIIHTGRTYVRSNDIPRREFTLFFVLKELLTDSGLVPYNAYSIDNSNPRDLNKFIKDSRSFLNPFLPSNIPEVIKVGPRCVLLFSEAYLFYSVVFLLNVESRSLSTHHGYLGPHPNHVFRLRGQKTGIILINSESKVPTLHSNDGFFNTESSALPTHLEFPSAHANHIVCLRGRKTGILLNSGKVPTLHSNFRMASSKLPGTYISYALPEFTHFVSSAQVWNFYLGLCGAIPRGSLQDSLIISFVLCVPARLSEPASTSQTQNAKLPEYHSESQAAYRGYYWRYSTYFCWDLLAREMTRIRYKVCCSPVLREVR